MDLLSLFFPPLILTILCELCVLFILLRRDYLKILGLVIILNGITNPGLNYLLLIHDYPVYLLEFLVIVFETIPVKFAFNLPLRDALLYSILMNAVSSIAGIAFYALK